MMNLKKNTIYSIEMVDKYKTFGKYLGFERGFFLFEEIYSKMILPVTKNHIYSIEVKQ